MEVNEEWDADSCFLPPGRGLCLDVQLFRDEIVTSHNRYRQLHGSPALKYLSELEEDAQMWAETIAAKGYLQYNEHMKNIGESICSIELSKNIPSGKDVVTNWYREIKHYSFSDPGWRKKAFHLTQMLWKSSTHIGIGIAPVPEKPRIFIVVRYFPAGNSNYPGEFQKNVLPRMSVPSERSSWCLDDSSFIRIYSGRMRSLTAEDVYI